MWKRDHTKFVGGKDKYGGTRKKKVEDPKKGKEGWVLISNGE